MDVIRSVQLSRIEEISILSSVRLVHRHDLNHFHSRDNLQVQFGLSGDLKGAVSCHLLLDGQELEAAERNYVIPLFVESMNILVGRQISVEAQLDGKLIKLSPPRLTMIPRDFSTQLKAEVQLYELELENRVFTILIEYSIEVLN